MTRIARRFHTSTRSLSYWNREKYPTLDPENAHYNADRVERGWVLQLIPNQEYVPPPDDGETGIEVTPTPDDEHRRDRQPVAGRRRGARRPARRRRLTGEPGGRGYPAGMPPAAGTAPRSSSR